MTIINQKSISGITSITFASAGDDLLTFHSNNGTERFRIDNSGNTKITAGIVTTLTVTGDVDIADKIVHTGDTNTAIRFPAADTFTVETGGSERLRVHTDGNVLLGTTSNQGSSRKLQVAATDSSSGMEAIRFTTSAGSAPSLTLSKSNSDTLNANTLVDSGDSLGYVQFKAANGSGYNTAAQIVGEVDGTPGVNDMPGRLVLSTTADGASTPTERIRIDSSGNVGINQSAPSRALEVRDASSSVNSIVRVATQASSTTTNGYAQLEFKHSTENSVYIWHNAGATTGFGGANSLNFYNGHAADYAFFSNGNNERVRIRNGGGITFNGDTAAANALDDYEEGTWTPTVTSAGSVTGEDAKYTKVGNLVHVYGKLTSFTDRSSSNTIVISSLPYTASTNQAAGSMFARYADRTAFTVYVYSNKIEFYSIGSGAFPALQHSQLNNSNAVIYFQATYNVA